ncbi:hypothetical protein BJ085DRAFT_28818 [Dimargaris cristalligena]|uniref:dolichol kinase n=1 Tax=Dimargaris cristalligena TaxID=215637 RepID=A0A4P9ZM91_9FUNG|nr:hypothetical protein BJ085DRAFT_28818 [Dimargaris cristalligena]|eukprot:RKP34456.1 hypothetical protein BJ085DRAFT_28818 [Dimargaris cristalligena]
MFIPCHWLAPDMLYLSMGIGWCALTSIELARILRISPLAEPINRFMIPFIDYHDSGYAILSHLYLIVGCAIPIWLRTSHPIANLAGILTLGLGDAAASIVGQSAWGRHHWPGSRKTVEGTVAFTLSVLIVTGVLSLSPTFQASAGPSGASWFIMSTTITAIGEALTDQNDNLYIPLILVILLNLRPL